MNLRLLSVIFALLCLGMLVFSKFWFAPKKKLTSEPAAEIISWRSDQQLRQPHQASTNAAKFGFHDFTIEPLAEFQLRARILSRENYRYDNEAKLSPLDLALGWGRMADPTIYQQFAISQSGRWYHYRWQGQPPIPPDEIISSSANMHMIPANAAIEKQLAQLKVGQIIKLQGYLIEARNSQGWRWRSSLSRDDTGAGACEVVWVRAVEIDRHHD